MVSALRFRVGWASAHSNERTTVVSRLPNFGITEALYFSGLSKQMRLKFSCQTVKQSTVMRNATSVISCLHI